MSSYNATPRMAPFLRILVCLLFVACVGLAGQAHAIGIPGLTASAAKSEAPAKATVDAAPQAVSLNQLADLLENDAARAQLVKQLRQAAQGQNKGAAQQASSAGKQPKTANGKVKSENVPVAQESFARRMARKMKARTDAFAGAVFATWHGIKALTGSDSTGVTDKSVNWHAFKQSVFIFAIVAIATVVAFLLLKFLVAPLLFRRIAKLPERADSRGKLLLRKTIAILLGLIVDVVAVCIAAGVGYLVGVYAVGDPGVMGVRQSLFINAFVMIELLKVLIRLVFSSRYEGLRPVQISSTVAAWWSVRLRWFVGVVGYTLLVIVPILNVQLSTAAGSVVTFVVMAGAYVYALIVIFGNRRVLTQRLHGAANSASLGFFAVLFRMFALLWPLLAVIYFTTLFVVSQLYPDRVLPDMLFASIKTLLVAVVCFSISGLLSHSMNKRMRLPKRIQDRLPLLESRINSYVPASLKFVRVLILLAFAGFMLDIWHLFDFSAWLETGGGQHFSAVVSHVVLILVVAAVLWIIGASLLELRMSSSVEGEEPSARQQTLLSLFRNTLAILIAVFVTMMVLAQIGVNIGPLIAGAGVLGLAIGFGAKELVQDVITGVFIQLENAMNTGDVVHLAGIWGTVERLTIRSTSVRDIDGGLHVIPFSSVNVVSNYMREFAYHRYEYRVAYRENIDNAVVVLREAFAELKQDPAVAPNILEEMTVPGVTTLADNEVKIRIMIKTAPGAQWSVGRAYNRLVKMHFERAGIEIPYPQRQLWFGEDHDGNAPSAKFRVIDAEEEQEHRDHYRIRRRKIGDQEAPNETGAGG